MEHFSCIPDPLLGISLYYIGVDMMLFFQEKDLLSLDRSSLLLEVVTARYKLNLCLEFTLRAEKGPFILHVEDAEWLVYRLRK